MTKEKNNLKNKAFSIEIQVYDNGYILKIDMLGDRTVFKVVKTIKEIHKLMDYFLRPLKNEK